AMNRAEVPSSVVGELVMERLKALDHIAYIRFASVYRAFADVDELEQELEALKAGWRRPDIPPDQLALLPDLTPKTASARILRVRPRRAGVCPRQDRRRAGEEAAKEGPMTPAELATIALIALLIWSWRVAIGGRDSDR